jgi:hypothetical protein
VQRDEVGARVHDRVGEGHRVAAVLAEEHLRARADARVGTALAAEVAGDDDQVGESRRLAHEALRGGQLARVLRPRVRREAEHGHARVLDLHDRDLTGAAGGLQAGGVQRCERLRAAGAP